MEILIYGAVTSAIYAMLAVGFTLIFGVARVLNLAHGRQCARVLQDLDDDRIAFPHGLTQ